MSIICGFLKDGECSTCSNTCSNYIPVYSCKDYHKEILKTIANIYSKYKLSNIRNRRGIKYILMNLKNTKRISKISRLTINYNSLWYMMGIYGHCSQFENDLDDIFYKAANIVLIQQHLFKQCSTSDRYEAYKIMHKLGIKLDKKMVKDCKVAIRKQRVNHSKSS